MRSKRATASESCNTGHLNDTFQIGHHVIIPEGLTPEPDAAVSSASFNSILPSFLQVTRLPLLHSADFSY